jgi:predicted RNase H-like nuclease (RuvC/YqgF family)
MQSKNKRVYAQVSDGDVPPATQAEQSDGGAEEMSATETTYRVAKIESLASALQEDNKELKKRIKAIDRLISDFQSRLDTFDYAIHEMDEGKKVPSIGKARALGKYHHAWIMHAETVNPALKLEGSQKKEWMEKKN